MNRRRVLVGTILVVAMGSYVAYRIHQASQPLQWTGTVEAHTMDVGSRVGGRISKVLAREGTRVDAGQPILLFEPGDLLAQRLQAQGQLEQAQAGLEKVASKTLPTQRRAEIAAAQARLQAQAAVLQQAKLDDSRMEKLAKAGAATRQDRDNAAIGVRNATAQVNESRARLDQLLQGTPQDVKTAEGMVAVAEGRVQQIDEMIRELTVHAPRAAIIEAMDLRPGDILAPNQTAAKLLEPNELFVRIYVPETQIGRIRPGMEVPVSVDSFPGRVFKGIVEYVSSEGEFTPRNLQTADERADQVFGSRVRLVEGLQVLRAGMAATVEVPR